MPEDEFQERLGEMYVTRIKNFVRALDEILPKVKRASAMAQERGLSPAESKTIVEHARASAMLAAAMELPGHDIERKKFNDLPEWKVGDLPLPDGNWRMNLGDIWILILHRMYFWPVFEDSNRSTSRSVRHVARRYTRARVPPGVCSPPIGGVGFAALVAQIFSNSLVGGR